MATTTPMLALLLAPAAPCRPPIAPPLLRPSRPALFSSLARRAVLPFSLSPSLSQGRRRRSGCVLPASAQLNEQPSSGSSSSASPMYPGVYGPWSVESADVREVVLYRAGLVTAATTFIAAASTALLPDDNAVKSVIQSVYDPLYVVGAGGLGASLFLIHIYVTPIKRALQALWAVGVLGSVGVAVNFAAPESQGLSGLMDETVQVGLLSAWMALFALFASRKFTQPIKDDIGDKSVFIFKALPEDAQQALLRRLQEQQTFPEDSRR